MKDSEFYSGKEYYNCKETNKFDKEKYSPQEELNYNEDYSLKESNFENKSSRAQTTKKATLKLNDRVVESTAPMTTIVSAATCTIAVATVVGTTFLNPTPLVDMVSLLTGNDYVEYNLNLSQLDVESKYKVQVINANFDYSEQIDVAKADALEYLDGYIYGLKPNNSYTFKLLRDNGDVGGYSDFYTKKFYTKKPANPTALISVKQEDDKIKYDVHVSDAYNLLSDTMIICDPGPSYNPETILLESDDYSSYINGNGRDAAKIEVWSTLDGDEILLASSEYSPYFFDIDMINGKYVISGSLGSEYESLENVSINLYAYSLDGFKVINQSKEISSNESIEESFDIGEEISSLYFSITSKSLVIYKSNAITLDDLIPNMTFGSQEIIDEGLKVSIPEMKATYTGTIKDKFNVDHQLICQDGSVIIPLIDENNKKIAYSDYNLVINGKVIPWTSGPDMTLLEVKDFELYTFNQSLLLVSNGFSYLYDDSYKLKVEFLSGTQVLGSTIIGPYERFTLGDFALTGYTSFDIRAFVVDHDETTELTTAKIQTGVVNKDSISTTISNSDNGFNVTLSGTLDYQMKLSYFNSDGNLLNSEIAPLVESNGVKSYQGTLQDDVASVSYEILIDNKLIYSSKKYTKINVNIISQEITTKGLVLHATGVDPSMNAYILDTNNSTVNLIVDESTITIPLSFGRTITDYSIYISNELESKVIQDPVEDMMLLDNVHYLNSYSGTGLTFTPYIVCHEASYNLCAQAYDADGTLLGENGIDNQNIFGTVTMLNEITNASTNITYKVSVKGIDMSMTICPEQEFTLVNSDMNAPDYTFEGVNPGEVTITYNDDGTINAYLPVNFSCDDAGLFARIVLTGSDGKDIVLETKDKIAVFENLKNQAYYINYTIAKKSGTIEVFYEDFAPSGGFNEDSIVFLSAIKNEGDNGNIYVNVDVSDYVNQAYDATKCYFEGYDNATYDEITKTWTVKIEGSETSIVMHLFANVSQFDSQLQRIMDIDPNYVLKGSYNHEIIVTLTIQ